MDESARPPLDHRLRLVGSLLQAVEDSISPLRRLLAEAQTEIGLALQDDAAAVREAELVALRREVQQLREGLASRAVIERAKGILMQARGLTEQEAFDVLDELSQRLRRKLRDVAADIAADLADRQASPTPAGLVAVADEPAGQPARRPSAR
jgi:hypothetical protein